MEKITDFAKYLTLFFTEYLVLERGVSKNTIRSYGDTFSLVIEFMRHVKYISADRLKLVHFNRTVVLEFLDWLQSERHCSVSTRNTRLAALHTFFYYLQYVEIQHISKWQEILTIKIKRGERTSFSHMSMEGVKALLGQIPTDTIEGRRHLAMLSFLYDSGARAQELIDVTPENFSFEQPPFVVLYGKGRKKRIVPIQGKQIDILKIYMRDIGLDKPQNNTRPLFTNAHGGKLTTAGLTYIINHYANMVRIQSPGLIPDRISPHTFRHSKAMHLFQAGVNLVYIRDILGHVSIQTTEIYARADSKQKREALEKVYVDVVPTDFQEGSWERDSDLKKWLKGLGR